MLRANYRLVALTAFTGIIALLAAAPANAQTVVYDNGITLAECGYAFGSNAAISQYASSDFTLGSAVSVTQARFYGLAFSATSASAFTVGFYAVTAGVPEISPSETPTIQSVTATDVSAQSPFGPGSGTFEYLVTFSSAVDLPAGNFAFAVNSDSSIDGANFLWMGINSETGGFGRTSTSGAWESQNANYAFQLLGPGGGAAAPEPGSLALLLPVVGGIIARRKKK